MHRMSPVNSQFNSKTSRRPLLSIAVVGSLLGVTALGPITAQAGPLLTRYFNSTVATNGSAIGGFDYDPASDSFWIGSFVVAGAQIRNIKWNGSAWVPTGTGNGTSVGPSSDGKGHVSEATWFLYKRADATQTTSAANENNAWSGSQMTVGSIILNPLPITINGYTHPARTLGLINDSGNTLQEVPSSGPNIPHPELTKRVYWYNLTETNTAIPGVAPAPGSGTDYNGNSAVDWNDQFRTVLTHENMNTADPEQPVGSTAGPNLARSFAYSSDGQSIYMLDSASNYGGIYKIGLNGVGSGIVTKVLGTKASGAGTSIANTEPAVVHTSVRDFDLANAGVGDQVIIEGSTAQGNVGGVNAYLDNGTTFSTTPKAVFTDAQFRAFAEYTGATAPGYQSITAGPDGTLYLFETETDMIFKYDSLGRFAKVVSEEEHNQFQRSLGGSGTDNYLDMKVRSDPTLHATRPVLLYSDAGLASVVGVTLYDTGDFDRDGDVDAGDRSTFLAALRPRGVANPGSANFAFDLNGNSNGTSSQTAQASSIVDWKDVKVLQQFLGFPNGDTNLDGALDFTDIDTMEANYYTLGGLANKTWANGDFASLDPLATTYLASAADANIVNFVDLQVLADAWLNLLGLPNLTFDDLDEQGYSGQFREDLIFAFDIQAEAVPEPSTLALMGLAGVGLVVMVQRRRRQMRSSAGR